MYQYTTIVSDTREDSNRFEISWNFEIQNWKKKYYWMGLSAFEDNKSLFHLDSEEWILSELIPALEILYNNDDRSAFDKIMKDYNDKYFFDDNELYELKEMFDFAQKEWMLEIK